MTPRSNPFDALERTFERMSRQFDEAARAWDRGETFDLQRFGGDRMAIDVVERDDEYVVTVDVPGFDRDEITVTMSDDHLRVEAEREETTEEETETYLRQERHHTSLGRSIRIPEDADPEGVSATTSDGVLTITIPRVETDEETHTIEIESE